MNQSTNKYQLQPGGFIVVVVRGQLTHYCTLCSVHHSVYFLLTELRHHWKPVENILDNYNSHSNVL